MGLKLLDLKSKFVDQRRNHTVRRFICQIGKDKIKPSFHNQHRNNYYREEEIILQKDASFSKHGVRDRSLITVGEGVEKFPYIPWNIFLFLILM